MKDSMEISSNFHFEFYVGEEGIKSMMDHIEIK
jgi:hypothetical protein